MTPILTIEPESTAREIVPTITLDAIIAEAKRIEENCLYTSKSHFAVAHFWGKLNLWVGIPTSILSAITGTLVFSNFSNLDIIAGILSIVVTISTGLTTFLDPKDKSYLHLAAGNNYDSLLTNARIFWTIDARTEPSIDKLRNKLEQLSQQRDGLNRNSPQPPRWAYNKAKRGINNGEVLYSY